MPKQKKFISLKTKTILLLVGVFFFMFVGTTGILSTVMLHRFETIEKADLTDHMTRTQNTIQVKVDRLEKIAFDWGVWDDTYTFISDHNEKYHEANLVEDVFTNLEINAMIFINDQGQIIHADAQNKDTGELELPSDALLDFVKNSPVLHNTNPGFILKGIIKLPEGAMLIASSPILPSDGVGPVKGNLLVAFTIDEAYVNALKEQLKLDLTLETIHDAVFLSTLMNQSEIKITTIDRDHIQAKSVLVDLLGNPAIKIVITAGRDTYNVGREGVFLAGAFIFLISGVCILILSFFMNFHFLTKLDYITSSVDKIGSEKDFSVRLKTPVSHDEFSIVIEEINGMLDDLETVHKENEFNANHDALTGLPNRRLLQELMTHSLYQSQRNGSKMALLFLDLDDFKIINDTKGHDFGDEVLKQVALRLSASLRKSDILARIGGDEFIVLLENVENIDQIKRAAEKILNCLKEVFTIKGHDFTISTSIGISQFPDDGNDAQTLIKKADLALYQTKVVGKSCYAFYATISSEKNSDSQI